MSGHNILETFLMCLDRILAWKFHINFNFMIKITNIL